MDIRKEIDLLDCPRCQGPALLEEENGWCWYVMCLDCGCHTAEVEFKSAEDRLQLVKEGTADLPNVTVYPTGPYLISSATFPTYFLKDREQAGLVQCRLDIEIFSRYFIPKFGITTRYVGTEPTSPMTNAYNEALKAHLPIPVREIPRLEADGMPISASTVRSLLGTGQADLLRKLVPDTTFTYLEKNALI